MTPKQLDSEKPLRRLRALMYSNPHNHSYVRVPRLVARDCAPACAHGRSAFERQGRLTS